MISLICFSRSLKGRCYGNRFGRVGENWHADPHSVRWHSREDRNIDARVNTAKRRSTPDKTLVTFGPVIIEFCWRVSKILLFLNFQDGVRSPSWIFKRSKF